MTDDRDVTAQPSARGDVAVVVPAAGAGVRLGPGAPKALRLLDGDPLLVHAIRRIAASPSVRPIGVAAPPTGVAGVQALLAGVAPVVDADDVQALLARVPPVVGADDVQVLPVDGG